MSESVSTRLSPRAAVGVGGGNGAVVDGAHGLQHVERLAAAALADDHAVGPHAHRVLTRSRMATPRAPPCGRPRLEAPTCAGVGCSSGRVLDGDDALVLRDRRGQHVSRVVLPLPVPPGDEHVLRATRSGGGSGTMRSVTLPNRLRSWAVGLARELADGDAGAAQRDGEMTALTREPSGRRASSIGAARRCGGPEGSRCARGWRGPIPRRVKRQVVRARCGRRARRRQSAGRPP